MVNASSVASMAMQRSVTRISASIVVRSYILLKIVNLRTRRKRQPTFSRRRWRGSGVIDDGT